MVFAWNCDCSIRQWHHCLPLPSFQKWDGTILLIASILGIVTCFVDMRAFFCFLLLGFTEGWIFDPGHMRAEYQKVYVN